MALFVTSHVKKVCFRSLRPFETLVLRLNSLQLWWFRDATADADSGDLPQLWKRSVSWLENSSVWCFGDFRMIFSFFTHAMCWEQRNMSTDDSPEDISCYTTAIRRSIKMWCLAAAVDPKHQSIFSNIASSIRSLLDFCSIYPTWRLMSTLSCQSNWLTMTVIPTHLILLQLPSSGIICLNYL